MHKCITTGPEPLIFDIARGSFVDGPGVRTTVFFKGCPLSCPWCHNPESQNYEMETMFFPEDCIHCGNCTKGKKCFALARRNIGKTYSPERLASLVLQDKHYYETSGGGVTFSGGESLGFIDYISRVILLLKKEQIHIAVQTCGYFDFNEFVLKILPNIDLIYFDFKIMDNEIHKRLLGKSNHLILENFRQLLEHDISVLPRIPLIPHFVANKENLAAIADFFLKYRVKHCEFLYYNPGSREKMIRLNRKPHENLSDKPVSMAENRAWIDYFKQKINA
ncbi:radical SAM protein [Desulfobacula phenolica]|uniref:Pyruvate formate lyase activating enzyme n=1 Tax=Desulfobacula phenolica TaxID=90732 RepID=A0A1H2H955_9BACT|nr:radical SAM protein [Desulfobacula phenolica]SDU28427.1 pyruvate formate lyase activating enzyme [Desulfobacula phenolica]